MATHSTLMKELELLGYTVLTKAYRDQHEAENGNPQWQYLTIRMENRHLQNGPFYYQQTNDFVHFTSLENMHAIIHSKCMRMYNLNHMDDHQEYLHGLHAFSFPDAERWALDKENLYCLSLCSFAEVNEDPTKEHLLWKLYGKNGYGVMLRFQFDNDLAHWEQYHLSKVYYEVDSASPILQVHKTDPAIVLDPKISSFFKHPIYSFENEVRLLFDARENLSVTYTGKNREVLYPRIYNGDYLNAQSVRFTELPLSNFFPHTGTFLNLPNNPEVEDRIPKIRLKEIILGYRYSKEQCERLRQRINGQRTDVLVRLSRLQHYYQDKGEN